MTTLLSIRAIGAEEIPPDPRGMIAGVARYGYTLNDALADLIDNSLDAGARNVAARFVRDDQAVRRIVIADDGRGMDAAQLRSAMQFGVQLSHGRTALGKYGLGLKSASFSQCSAVSVLTRDTDGWVGGRRWTMTLIERGWICERLDPEDCSQLLEHDWLPARTSPTGTVVIWDELDRLRLGRSGVDAALRTFMKGLPIDLGIVFHRFLGDGRLSITLGSENVVAGARSATRTVEALDPFAHRQSGREGYPVTFGVHVGEGPPITLRAHIWPANSKDPAYRLGGGRIAERQGFYVYRNDRIVQGGGWNGWRQNDSEPHTSLARAALDLPPELDTRFRLDVKKSRLDVPPEFITALDAARSGNTLLTDWIQAAVETYRSSDQRARRDAPTVLGRGLPARLQRFARRQENLTDVSAAREVGFSWEALDDDHLFDVDRESGRILLNRELRSEILMGANASGADAPLVKTLLFLFLRAELDHQRSSAARRHKLDQANALLREALRLQR
jgi:hypothetical protein